MGSTITKFVRSIFDHLVGTLDKIRNNRKLRLFVNIALVLLIVLFLGNYFSKEWETIKNVRIHITILPLAISFVLYGINYLLFIFGWHIILKSYGVNSSLLKNSYIYSSSQIAKILPTPAWFITGRLVLYQKEGVSKKIILTSTFLEIILHMLVGLVILAFTKINFSLPLTWLYGLSIIPLILLVIFPKTLYFPFLEIKDHHLKRSDLLLLILAFVTTWIISGPFFQYLLDGLNIATPVSMITLLQIWIISSIFAYIGSLTLGGIGVLREFSITILLGNILTPPIAVVVATISRIIMTLGNILWPLLIMGIVGRIKQDSPVEQNNNSDSLEDDQG